LAALLVLLFLPARGKEEAPVGRASSRSRR
jgi:hypothetical protein